MSDQPPKPRPNEQKLGEQKLDEQKLDEQKSGEPAADQKRVLDRRGFFTRGLREFLRPIADAAVEKIQEVEESFAPLRAAAAVSRGSISSQSSSSHTLPILRPPGALDEADFLSTCSRCNACVTACPAQCIRIDANVAGNAPFIVAQESACVVCTGLECMFVCPSGALVPTRLAEIDMGLAVWNADTCVRKSGQETDAQECTICIDDCPIGEVAIRLYEGKIQVLDGCVGCGVCENHCPTRPARSINVVPRAFNTPARTTA